MKRLIYAILNSKFKKFLVLVLTLVAFISSLAMFPSKLVLAKMLPSKSDNTFSIYVDAPSGSSYTQTQKISTCVSNILKRENEVLNLEVYIGMGAPLDYAGLVKGSSMKRGENIAEVVVNLSNKHTRDESSYMMVHRLRPIIQKNCQSKDVSIKMVEQPAGPPTLSSIVVELYGNNTNTLRHTAIQIKRVLEKTDGLVDVDVMQDDIYKKFKLVIDKEKLVKSGLSIEQANKILYLSFEGMQVAVKNSENSPEQIPLFLVLSDKSKNLSSFSKQALERKLSSLKLVNQKGMMIPLNEVISIKEVNSSPTIMSKGLQNMVNITAETDLVSQVYPLLDARAKIKKELSKDFDISSSHLFDFKLKDKKTGEILNLVWDGEMKVTMDTFRDLGGAFIAALVLIFLLMVVYYKSFAISGIILLGSFLSIIGVIFGHYIMDIFTTDTFFLTATSLIGFIALMGISSRNSLLLIDFTKSLILKGMKKKEAISVATATRAKPIFLTALAIILASTLLASDPIFGGLGVALIFGTIVAVIVSLIFVPVLMDNTKSI